MNKSFLNLTSALLILFSCTHKSASTQKRKVMDPRTTQRYSESKSSSVDPKVIDLYKRLREKDWKNYTNPKRYQPLLTPPKEEIEKIHREPVHSHRTKDVLTQKQKDEINAEIQQNLTYFCIQHEGSSPYSAKRNCKSYTRKVYNDCLDENDRIISRKVLSCVKKRLN